MMYFATQESSVRTDSLWSDFNEAMADVVLFSSTWAPVERTDRVLLPLLIWVLTSCPVSHQSCSVLVRTLMALHRSRHFRRLGIYQVPFWFRDYTQQRKVDQCGQLARATEL